MNPFVIIILTSDNTKTRSPVTWRPTSSLLENNSRAQLAEIPQTAFPKT